MPTPRRLPIRVLTDGRTIHTLHSIPGGTAGTRETLKIMRDITRTWRKHPLIRNLAMRITANCPAKDWACEIYALQRWVKSYIKYMRDVADVETVATPDVTLRDRAGDCDDQSVLMASLIQAIGHPVRFVAAAFGISTPFVHVFTETRLGGYWRPAETTEDRPIGWYPPGIRRRIIVEV